MKYRNFGGIKVSEIGMGCWAIGGNAYGNSYGKTNDDESIAAVRKALELGCTFFDTADVYGHGHSERILGTALGSARKDVVIATKAGGAYMYEGFGGMNFSKEYLNFALKQSMLRLQTDYIDVYQLHNPPMPVIQDGEAFAALKDMKDKGKIRFAGISIFTLEEGFAALEHVDCLQCVFNALDPRKYELMEAAKRAGVAVIIREPLANGLLTGKYDGKSEFDETDIRCRFPQDYISQIADSVFEVKKKIHRNATMSQISLKYVLAFDSVCTVIPGFKTARQVKENIQTSDMPDLTDEEMAVFGS